jgi:hypothetical protein
MSKKEIERDPNQQPIPGLFEPGQLKINQSPKKDFAQSPSLKLPNNIIRFKPQTETEDNDEHLSPREEQGYKVYR